MSVWAVVVAAGSGTRYGGAKQYERLGRGRVIDLAVAAAAAAGDGVVVVVPPERTADVLVGADAVVAGGSSRSASVRSGLAAVPDAAKIVVVHDAARPLASTALFEAVVGAVRAGADGAVPGVAVVDTVKRIGPGGEVVETLERAELVAVQTPQAFRASVLRRAHRGEAEASDDAALVERDGGRVVVVAGEAHNLKLTTPEDLATAEAWLAAWR
ncbi:MAG: 2-C-methyl-D-erythritol 4-phosphate cytidylyltransferase [Actinomycetota bacterium]|nr:2-C-methyl-D-erythritol 4-phosphate cytidylyltransferase [Actinomycetota bacterium]